MRLRFLILGSKNERALAEELIQFLELEKIKVRNLCGEISIQIAAALLKKSLLLIANDSGLTHLAHALEVPVVAIYGPVDPTVYGPYPRTEKVLVAVSEGPVCRPCYQQFRYQGLCGGLECLTGLTPDHVFQQVENSGLLKLPSFSFLK